MFKKAIFVMALLAAMGTVHAAEVDPNIAKITDKMSKMLGDKVFVAKTNMGDLYEVDSRNGYLYVTPDMKHLIAGEMFDLSTRQPLSGTYTAKYNAERYSNIPKEWAIKQVYGKGEREVFVFEDPYCTYCQRVDAELSKIGNITVYTLLVPIISRKSPEMADRIWCSDDPARAWDLWMLHDEAPAPLKKGCSYNLKDKVLDLADQLRVHGTPALFFPNGKRLNGYVDKATIEETMNAKSALE